jgi:DNA-directed RNA polymerase subunit RPC12/RpoP
MNSNSEDWKLYIGEDVTCPICHNYVLTQPRSMICYDCSNNYENKIKNNFGVCAYCGSTLPEDDMIEVYDSGDKVCPSCADKHTSICIKCGRRYPNDEMKVNKTLCSWCLIDLKEENR